MALNVDIYTYKHGNAICNHKRSFNCYIKKKKIDFYCESYYVIILFYLFYQRYK